MRDDIILEVNDMPKMLIKHISTAQPEYDKTTGVSVIINSLDVVIRSSASELACSASQSPTFGWVEWVGLEGAVDRINPNI